MTTATQSCLHLLARPTRTETWWAKGYLLHNSVLNPAAYFRHKIVSKGLWSIKTYIWLNRYWSGWEIYAPQMTSSVRWRHNLWVERGEGRKSPTPDMWRSIFFRPVAVKSKTDPIWKFLQPYRHLRTYFRIRLPVLAYAQLFIIPGIYIVQNWTSDQIFRRFEPYAPEIWQF